ncbi:MAG: hypothetical protein IJW13_00240 [Clostridia bacterium]|nr:hypothetical protein [Clostridia bacterium]
MTKIKKIGLLVFAFAFLLTLFGCGQSFYVYKPFPYFALSHTANHLDPSVTEWIWEGEEMSLNQLTLQYVDRNLFPNKSDFKKINSLYVRSIDVTLNFDGEAEYKGSAWSAEYNDVYYKIRPSLLYVYPGGKENGHLVIEVKCTIDYSKTYINYDENLQIYYYVANCVVITDKYYNKYQGKQMTLTYDYELPIRSTVN